MSKLFIGPDGRLMIKQYCYTRMAMCLFEVVGTKGVDFVYQFIQRIN